MAAILASGGSWRWGYASVAAVQAVLGTVFFATRGAWGEGTGAEPSPPGNDASPAGARGQGGREGAASYRETLARGSVWLGILAFLLYAGLEFAVGQWAFSLLTLGRGLETGPAGLWVGLFFGGFFGGRVLAGFLPLGDRLRVLLVACPLGMLAGSLLARFGGTGPATAAGLAILGLACAPVYPALVAATPARLGNRHAANAMGMQVASATLGIAVLPGLTGILARLRGLESIASAWIAGSVALLLCLAAMARDASGGPPPRT
jgi:fucose permease